MAIKSMLFLFVFVIAVTQMASSSKDVDNVLAQHGPHVGAPVEAPVHAPKKAPVHAPKKAPVQAPKKAPVHAPKNAPVLSPNKPPTYPTVPPMTGCVALCMEYCKPINPKRPCMRVCKPCCDSLGCVPSQSGKCGQWNKTVVMVHGKETKCPSLKY